MMQIEEPENNRKPMTKQLPWVEKYRPATLEQVIAHEDIINTIKRFQQENKLPNLLLYGPPGTGKTSTVFALAREIYGKSYPQMVLELNASDERGIDTVRETIKRFAETQALNFRQNTQVKLIILDEADAMTSAAQFALRRIIEKHARTTRFCFICNYVSKIIPALQSRCTRFKFKQIPYEQSSIRAKQICQAENLNLNEEAIRAVFKLCDGDMRRVVNMLQSLSMSVQGGDNANIVVDQKYVYQFTGMADPDQINHIFEILLNFEKIQNAYDLINDILINNGISLQLLLKELTALLLRFEMPDNMKIHLVSGLADIEYRLSLNCSNQFQLQALLAIFKIARQVQQA